jgi:hypothetical protein
VSRAKAIIRELIFEAANLDRGLVAVEFEVLIRNDLGTSIGSKELYSDRLTQLALSLGFNVVPDASVKRIGKRIHRERLYQNCEFNNIEPGHWSKISNKLASLMSWLKHSDDVPVVGGVIVRDPTPTTPVYSLPRATLPVNSSAGLHIHFDVNSWFDDDQHAKRFLILWNSIRQGIPRHLPTARYGEPGARGHRYASLDPMVVPTDYEVAVFKKDWASQKLSGGEMARQYLALVPQHHRYWAVNTNLVAKRGDIEFRFIHATLNSETVEGWVRALAEMIEFARKPLSSAAPTDVRAGFAKYVHGDAADTATFLKKTAQHYTRSKDPEKLLKDEPSRFDQRLFRKPKAPSRFQRQRIGQRAGSRVSTEPELAVA